MNVRIDGSAKNIYDGYAVYIYHDNDHIPSRHVLSKKLGFINIPEWNMAEKKDRFKTMREALRAVKRHFDLTGNGGTNHSYELDIYRHYDICKPISAEAVKL